MTAAASSDPHPRTGFLLGIGAYAAWGFLPIYFKLLKSVGPVAIVAHRICWSLIVMIVLLSALRGWRTVRDAFAHRRTLALLSLSATLIAVNWLVYVYAINNGHILAGSLGYYLNPLANIVMGRFLLHERLSRLQWAAVGVAAAGIAVLAVGALAQLWISVVLCGSFASYGFVRKIVAADALTGLAIETALLFPLALCWLLFASEPGTFSRPPSAHVFNLLSISGVLTSVPLLLFAGAARRLPYSTLGMLQFLAPTIQFLIAVFVYGEPFTPAHAVAFGAIWVALALYVTALLAAARARRLPDEPAAVMVR